MNDPKVKWHVKSRKQTTRRVTLQVLCSSMNFVHEIVTICTLLNSDRDTYCTRSSCRLKITQQPNDRTPYKRSPSYHAIFRKWCEHYTHLTVGSVGSTVKWYAIIILFLRLSLGLRMQFRHWAYEGLQWLLTQNYMHHNTTGSQNLKKTVGWHIPTHAKLMIKIATTFARAEWK